MFGIVFFILSKFQANFGILAILPKFKVFSRPQGQIAIFQNLPLEAFKKDWNEFIYKVMAINASFYGKNYCITLSFCVLYLVYVVGYYE